MSEQPMFTAGHGLLRVALLPRNRTVDTEKPVDLTDEPSMLAYLAALTSDPLLREAVDLASPSLGRAFDVALAGDRVSVPKLRSLVLSASRYVLRMTTRATPFGLFSGVTVARFSEEPSSPPSPEGAFRVVKPDTEWLTNVVRDCEMDLPILQELRVVTSNLGYQRGHRWVMPYRVQSRRGSPEGRPWITESSVRLTPAVRHALVSARSPLLFRDLAQCVQSTFPSASSATVSSILRQLVEGQFLLTELQPQPDETKPLEHIIGVLGRVGVASAGGVLARLEQVQRELDSYAASPLGAGRRQLAGLKAQMSVLEPTPHSVRVDVGLADEAHLPAGVAAEAERAASVLCRMSPPKEVLPSLRSYHQAFLERYGADLVPVTDVLDPVAGLGAPQGYKWAPGRLADVRGGQSVPTEATSVRETVLLRMAMSALRSGSPEVILEDRDVEALALSPAAVLPPSMELFGTVVAVPGDGAADGEFRLVLNPRMTSPLAGAAAGRFVHIVGAEDGAAGSLDRHFQWNAGSDALRATLAYRSPRPRTESLMAVPDDLPYRIAIGCFADARDPRILALHDLAIGADSERLFVMSRRLGKEVRPTTVHLQNRTNMPHAARLLREIGLSGSGPGSSWDWGSARSAPYLPRVRYGRTVLAPAQWRTDEDFFKDEVLTDSQWHEQLQEWQKRWRVPGRVLAGVDDQVMELDLSVALHVRLLREEVRRHSRAILCETSEGAAGVDGGLHANGQYASEVVIPLATHGAAQSTSVRRRPVASMSWSSGTRYLPGGEWLYAKLYAPQSMQDDLLSVQLGQFADRLPRGVDRWFFIRYRDPDPHLRLRFHGDPELLHQVLLPELKEWASELTDLRLAARFVLDTYEPETGRYGGVDLMGAAERVFHADSVATLSQLAMMRQGMLRVDRSLLVAMNYVDIARRSCPGGSWASWCMEQYAPDESLHRSLRPERQALLSLLGKTGEPGEMMIEAGTVLTPVWDRRGKLLTAYRDDAGGKAAIRSLLHMHHNRFIGMDRTHERRVEALVRGTAQAHLRQRLRRRD
ncbi:hypothetical protein DN069_20805 [Streptacidiphilus pinicola]|uniref:Lantibiotic dehydratase n=1 Tax=Streptacidiphilus pinicola TaxID=2219663 RepID=A0A2X0J0H5_9ACTN|nr:lantibiotic dehydratase [Streptacidiphilus pinicola]RAG83696.1 hypothetical protein DN069_20805 [Streptacidiphilus pinicola]